MTTLGSSTDAQASINDPLTRTTTSPALDARGVLLLRLAPGIFTTSFEDSSRGYGIMCSRGDEPLHIARGMNSKEFEVALSTEVRRYVKRVCNSMGIKTGWSDETQQESSLVAPRRPLRQQSNSSVRRQGSLVSRSVIAEEASVEESAAQNATSSEKTVEVDTSFGLSPTEHEEISAQVAKRLTDQNLTRDDRKRLTDVMQVLDFSKRARAALSDPEQITDLDKLLWRIDHAGVTQASEKTLEKA